MGKGVEGCGVTKYAVELQRATGAEVFELSSKKWPRRKSHRLEYGSTSDLAPDVLSTYDLVILLSLPVKKHEESDARAFLDLYRSVGARKVMVYLDHSTKSVHDCFCPEDFIRASDLVMTYSSSGDLAKFIKKREIDVPIKTLVNPFDYDFHRSQHWKPIGEQDSRVVRWIGRTAKWKGLQLMLDFHESHLRPEGMITVLEGIEAGVTYVFAMYHDEFEKKLPRDIVNCFRTNADGSPPKPALYGEEVPGPAYCYPPYVHAECMERVSRSAFGSNLYNLSPEKYGQNAEFCHSEVVASGVVPIFHEHFGDHVVHRGTGAPASSTPSSRSGTIWLSPDTVDESRDLIVRLSRDATMRDEWREAAFEFWKSHNDAARVAEETLAAAASGERVMSDITEFFA